MSINFTAKVSVGVSYLDQDDTWTEPFNQFTSELDLGNFRALRSICPVVDGYIEDCGQIILNGETAREWLRKAAPNAGVQVDWALGYLHPIVDHVAICNQHDQEQPTSSTKSSVTVEVTWG
jgi:hypothetical protein